MTEPEISREAAERFCAGLAGIDDVVRQINAEGAVVNLPADMGRILARLGEAFRSAADTAPTDSLRDSVLAAANMFTDASEPLLTDPPLIGIERAQEVYAETMGKIENEAGPEVTEFRKKYCGAGD
jgi:hypothetical protein